MSDQPVSDNIFAASVALTARTSVALDQNPAAVYLASLGPGSQQTMRTALNILGELLGIGVLPDTNGRDMRCLVVPWANLRVQHTTAIWAALQQRYAPATANKLLAALRRVLKETRRLGLISAEDYDRAADIKSLHVQRLPRGRSIDDAEVAAVLRVCAEDGTSAGARDAALIALLRGTGMRRAEAVALDLADYDLASGALTIRDSNGPHDRMVYLPPGARAALVDWIAVRGNAPGPFFYGLVKGGGLVVRRLAAQAVAVVCAARAGEAGVTPFTPHDLRHTFISTLLDTDAAVVTVQQLVGHGDPATTSRYDQRSEAAKQRASERVHVPYFPRQSHNKP